jgi:hypothetical protein
VNRHLVTGALAALLVVGGPMTADAQQTQDEQVRPGMMQQQQQRGPGMMDMHRGMAGERDMRRSGREYRMRGMGRYGGMRAMRGHHMMGDHMLRMMIILMDTDGDGALSLEEVQAVTERFFNAMDADGDGRLTLDEIRAFYMPGGMPALEDTETPEFDGEEDEDAEEQ